MDNIKGYLNSNNVRPSYPRLRIFEYLDSKKNHPTADQIYTALYPEMPTLSKTTVYNTLNLFVKEGIAKVITIEDGEARYDADTSTHGHFKCLDCGSVYDFRIDLTAAEAVGLEGFQVEKREIYYFGKCKNCL